MKQLEEIKARASAAAVGPWRWDENFGDKGDEGTALTNDIGTEIIGAYNFHCCSYRDEPTVDESSAEFIAAARIDVPRLVAALEAVEEVLTWLDEVERVHPSTAGRLNLSAAGAAAVIRGRITDALELA